MNAPAPNSDRLFNNADSFAQAFDEAWRAHRATSGDPPLEGPEKLERILAEVADHPFASADPVTARQVAEFRLRLLGL